jgi:hypothetical protein
MAFTSRRTSAEIEIATDAGVKRLTLLERSGSRYTFRAFMGEATNISRVSLDAGGERVDAVTLRWATRSALFWANQQSAAAVARALAVHSHFPGGRTSNSPRCRRRISCAF